MLIYNVAFSDMDLQCTDCMHDMLMPHQSSNEDLSGRHTIYQTHTDSNFCDQKSVALPCHDDMTGYTLTHNVILAGPRALTKGANRKKARCLCIQQRDADFWPLHNVGRAWESQTV